MNKGWGYGDAKPDHYFLAPNYRMNELTGAVALAQLEKLDFSVHSRIRRADELSNMLEGIPGIQVPKAKPGSMHYLLEILYRCRIGYFLVVRSD